MYLLRTTPGYTGEGSSEHSLMTQGAGSWDNSRAVRAPEAKGREGLRLGTCLCHLLENMVKTRVELRQVVLIAHASHKV